MSKGGKPPTLSIAHQGLSVNRSCDPGHTPKKKSLACASPSMQNQDKARLSSPPISSGTSSNGNGSTVVSSITHNSEVLVHALHRKPLHNRTPVSSPSIPASPTRDPSSHKSIPADIIEYKPVPTPWQRCIVESFSPSAVRANTRPRTKTMSKILKCRAVDPTGSSMKRIECVLKGEWMNLVLAKGDNVNVISPELTSEWLACGSARTGDQHSARPLSASNDVLKLDFSDKSPQNYLVAHPDIAFTATSVAHGVVCARRSLVMELVKEGGSSSITAVVLGNIVHELLQMMLRTREFSTRDILAHLDAILRHPAFQLDIWSCQLSFEKVRAVVWKRAKQTLVHFGSKWVGDKPKRNAVLEYSAGTLAITNLLETEEMILSPKWGMIGRIDASVDATIRSHQPTAKVNGKKVRIGRPAPVQVESGTMPFEIKAGWCQSEIQHRAQTLMYTLLMEERYRMPITAGLLYFAGSDWMLKVSATSDEIRSLLMLRNELATYASRQRPKRPIVPVTVPGTDSASIQMQNVIEEPSCADPHPSHIVPSSDIEELPILPPMINDNQVCSRCFALDACMLYRRSTDKTVPPHQDEHPANLYETKTHHLTPLDLEFFAHWEQLISIEDQEMQRLKKEIWTIKAAVREACGRCFANMKIVKHATLAIPTRVATQSYTFARADEDASDYSLLKGHFDDNDFAWLSVEPNLIVIARGNIVKVTRTEVIVKTEYDLERLLARSGRDPSIPVVWRIDKAEMLIGAGTMRHNLARLFYAQEDGGDHKRRQLIAHSRPPTFYQVQAPGREKIPDHLKPDQRLALKKVLTARDYALIHGMTGDGRTAIIVEIVMALVKRGKSVLLTSGRHAAVDAILMKLVKSGHGILRLGDVDKIHPDIHHLSLNALGPVKQMSELDDRLMGPQIVATTCLSIDHPILTRRKFDYCIVDEASQIPLPTCLGPLRFAETFVLVGDHYQGPPTVRSAEAKRGALDVSLFKLLSDRHPEAVVYLSGEESGSTEALPRNDKC